jgi:gluconolactonase
MSHKCLAPGPLYVGHFPARLSLLLVFSMAMLSSNGRADSGNPSESASSGANFGRIEILDERLDELIPTGAKLEVIADGFRWSEGPLWLDTEQLIVFSDVPENKIYAWSESGGLVTYLEPSGYTGKIPRKGEPGSNGLALDGQGRLVLCQHGDRRIARMASPVSEPQPDFETLVGEYQGKRFNSPNDLVFDSSGNLYFTDPPYGLEQGPDDPARETDWSGVYRLSREGKVTLLYADLTRPNGIGLSPDQRTLYVANSDPDDATWTSFYIGEDGSLGEPILLHDATAETGKLPGLPDGLKVNREGYIFATGPGGVYVFDPLGKLLGRVFTGEPTANLTFNTDESVLYITANDKLMRLRLD